VFTGRDIGGDQLAQKVGADFRLGFHGRALSVKALAEHNSAT
jgi:hypothetical protein